MPVDDCRRRLPQLIEGARRGDQRDIFELIRCVNPEGWQMIQSALAGIPAGPAASADAGEPLRVSVAGDAARIDGVGDEVRIAGNAVEVLHGGARHRYALPGRICGISQLVAKCGAFYAELKLCPQ